MGRRQIYYSANSVGPAQLAKPGEFIDQETLKPYVGIYCVANETYLTGGTPSPTSRVLRPATGKEGQKFSIEDTTKYYELTRREYTNHTEPEHLPIWPTEENYEAGQFDRYFVQKKNEPLKIYEVTEESFKGININNQEGINGDLYFKIKIQWMLKGKDSILINKKNIDIAEKTMPGIKEFVPDPIQYTKGGISDISYYADGKEINPKLPEAYNISQKTGQNCYNCYFRNTNFCRKWAAQIRNEYWCASWRHKLDH